MFWTLRIPTAVNKVNSSNSVIEHKRCPTENVSHQQNQNQNRPIQNCNTSHVAKACRLRASNRAEYALVDASGARRRTCQLRAGRRASLRAGKRAGQARPSARSVRVGAHGASASVRAKHARRSARSTRVGARVAGRRIRPFFSVGLSQSGAVVWVRWSGPVPGRGAPAVSPRRCGASPTPLGGS